MSVGVEMHDLLDRDPEANALATVDLDTFVERHGSRFKKAKPKDWSNTMCQAWRRLLPPFLPEPRDASNLPAGCFISTAKEPPPQAVRRLCRVQVGVVRPFVGSSRPLQCWWRKREREVDFLREREGWVYDWGLRP